MDTFQEWLNQQLQERNWSQSEFARRSGITRQAVNNYITGKVARPDEDALRRIAKGLQLPPDVVFRRAGTLPPLSEYDDLIREIEHIANQLTERRREELAAYARLQLELQEGRGEYRVSSPETSKP